jgi:hypothetical protein
MTDAVNTRRQLVKGAAATLGGIGLLSARPQRAHAAFGTPAEVLTVLATAEVLATIVNTVGAERVDLGDDVTRRNVRAAAREELTHYRVLVSPAIRARPATKRVWVPDAVFASRAGFLSGLEVGEQVLCNAYLIATTVFSYARNGFLARVSAEIMGVEAVHRALARQSLGKLGNDRAFVKFAQRERTANAAPNPGQPGFTDILDVVGQLRAGGFEFGRPGTEPGRLYDFDEVSRRVPTEPQVNTTAPA